MVVVLFSISRLVSLGPARISLAGRDSRWRGINFSSIGFWQTKNCTSSLYFTSPTSKFVQRMSNSDSPTPICLWWRVSLQKTRICNFHFTFTSLHFNDVEIRPTNVKFGFADPDLPLVESFTAKDENLQFSLYFHFTSLQRRRNS